MNTWRRITLLLAVLLMAMLIVALPAAANGHYLDTVFVSAEEAGMTGDGVAYDVYDIVGRSLYSNGSATPDSVSAYWFKLFDGENYGLNSNHDIAAFSVDMDSSGITEVQCTTLECYDVKALYISFDMDARHVPGITPKVRGQDVVVLPVGNQPNEASDGDFEMYFDGSDVGLTLASEKIDGLDVWTPDDYTPTDVSLPYDCTAGILFISTRGNYRVTSAHGPALVGDGSDVLIFCATNLGADTAGFWFRGFDSSEWSMTPRSAMSGLDVQWLYVYNGDDTIDQEDAALEFLFTVRTAFSAYSAAGDPSEVFGFPDCSGVYGPIDDLNAVSPALNGTVAGFEVPLYHIITSDC